MENTGVMTDLDMMNAAQTKPITNCPNVGSLKLYAIKQCIDTMTPDEMNSIVQHIYQGINAQKLPNLQTKIKEWYFYLQLGVLFNNIKDVKMGFVDNSDFYAVSLVSNGIHYTFGTKNDWVLTMNKENYGIYEYNRFRDGNLYMIQQGMYYQRWDDDIKTLMKKVLKAINDSFQI